MDRHPVNSQYLSKDQLVHEVGILDLNISDLISADTYNESEMLSKYKKFSDVDKVLLYKAAVQLAVIGYGNRNYGSVRIDDKNVIALTEIFQKTNVKFNKSLDEKYKDDDFSVRRLLRFFRYQIQTFITKSNRPSYLWMKYSDKNLTYMNICFPGAEHLVETKEEANYLLQTYAKLDSALNTKFLIRLKRVFIARGVFSPLELQ